MDKFQVNLDNVDESFREVGGLKEAKNEITELITGIPKSPIKLGGKQTKAAIMLGPPGVGKSLIARAAAKEFGIPFFRVFGWQLKTTEDLSSTIASVENKNGWLFIDKIDSMEENLLNHLASLLDFSTKIKILGATNEPLPKDIFRAGQFMHFELSLPNLEDRVEIITIHLRGVLTENDVTAFAWALAEFTDGQSGAEIASLINEATLIAGKMEAPAPA